MSYPPALLEDFLRENYFNADTDIGSSGVECFTYGALREIVGDPVLDRVMLCDSTSWGGSALRDGISRRWGDGDPDHVMVTHGSTEAIYLVMVSLISPGDEIVLPSPVYFAFPSIVDVVGGRVTTWPLRASTGFAADVQTVIDLIGARTRMVVVNFPHNPTGTSISLAEAEELIAAAARVGAYLVWDGALTDLTYDEPPLVPPVLGYERGIVLGTLSKAYGLPGLRFGWCLGSRETLAALVPLRDRLTLHLSPLVEAIAQRVVARVDDLLAIRLAQARRNRDLLLDWARTADGLVELPVPRGGVTAFPRLPGITDVTGLCHQLVRDHRVLLVPGSCFGFADRVRLGFGGSAAELSMGLDILATILRDDDRR